MPVNIFAYITPYGELPYYYVNIANIVVHPGNFQKIRHYRITILDNGTLSESGLDDTEWWLNLG